MGASGGGRAGIFGHHTATTGRTDLAACRLERWRSVWVDLDG
jgi:hypothetical protein